MQLVEAVRDVRVVVEVGGVLRPAVAGRPPERIYGEQLAELDGRREHVAALEPARALGQRGEREAVPRRDHLVVQAWLRALLSNREQPLARLFVELAPQDRATVLERLQQLGRSTFVRRPRVRQPFDAVGVGVLRRGEAASRQAQLAQHVLERTLRHLAESLLPGEQPGVEVRRNEERVVVEHLLEVRHEPLCVDGVPVEAAADEVVHPACGHPLERQTDRTERPRAGAEGARGLRPSDGGNAAVACSHSPQQKLECRRGGELGRVPEAPPARIELGQERALGLEKQRLGQELG